MSDRPSRLQLAQLVSGDLPADEAEALESRLAGSEESQQELAELQHNVAAFEQRADQHLDALRLRLQQELADAPSSDDAAPAPVPAPVSAPPGRRWWSRWLWVPAAAAAAAAVLAVVLIKLPPAPQPEIAFRGDLALQVVAKRGERQFIVEQDAVLAEADALRFVVTTATAGYISVFSVDGRGAVSPFYPESDPSSDPEPLPVHSPGQHELPGSIVLDDAPGPEHLTVVFSHRRFDRAKVHERVRRALERGDEVSTEELEFDGVIEVLRVKKRPRK